MALDDVRIGYRSSVLQVRIIKHEIGFETGISPGRLIELLTEIPNDAVLHEVLADEDDDVVTMSFTQECECEQTP